MAVSGRRRSLILLALGVLIFAGGLVYRVAKAGAGDGTPVRVALILGGMMMLWGLASLAARRCSRLRD